MTLSPNRSYKNLPELRNATTATSIFSFYYLTRVVLPLCLLVSSILIYVVIYSMEDQALDSGSGTDLLSASVLWRESLKHQMANIKANGMLQARASDLDITDLQYIAEFKPFDLPSGINVWDLYYPQVSCPDVVRLGRYGEGGKWVCGMSMLGTPKLEQHAILSSHHLNRHNRKCVMYSFGISTDISFEVEILLTTNCVIHAFDPTVGSLPFQNLNHNLNSTVGQELRNRIHFHKIALNDRSGSTEYHTLNEHLYDIMLRLNHTFIDLLKVDVEGSEWDIFDQLFKHKIRVPVGELMIELHHKSMLQTNSFFVDAAAQGFIPFSREINLIPTFGGGDPFAVEYSFINYENLYHGAVYPEPKSPGTSYIHILMELSPNGSLQDLVEKCRAEGSRIPDNCLWKIVHDMAAGLHCIHSCGVVHLDIKPSNVLISSDGTLKIGDFGLAEPVGGLDYDSEGDCRYMALELLNESVRLPSADIFSLGITLYELSLVCDPVVGYFEFPTDGPLWHTLRNGQYTLPSGRPAAFEQLLRSTMAPSAEQRVSAEAILRDLSPEVTSAVQQGGAAAALPLLLSVRPRRALDYTIKMSRSPSFDALNM